MAVLCGVLACSTVYAAEAGESAVEIVVAGSRLSSANASSPSPVVRLDTEELLHQGTTRAAELLNSLPQVNSTLTLGANGVSVAPLTGTATVDLRGFAQDARVLAEHRDLHFELVHDGSGEALYEPRWLRRVLLNLLANALDASPPGGLVRLQSSIGDGRWRGAITDQGPGVPAGERERIFERFVRLSGAEREGDGGSGLGLAICRSIATLHGGSIHAQAGPDGRGLCVVLEIPQAESVPAAAAAADATV